MNEGEGFRLVPPSASNFAPSVDLLFWFLTATSGLIVLLLAALIVTFGIRYRAGVAARDGLPPPRTMNWLEWTWIGVFTLYGIVIFVWAARLYFDASSPPANARTIYVVGKQWMWKVQHAGGRQEINELHVPLGEPIQLVLRSQDVIHSFFVPAFRLKQDVLPNRYTRLWFTPTRVGRYFLFCAEYCGTDHSRMRGYVHVMEPTDFQRWLSAAAPGPIPGTPGTPQAPMAIAGEEVFLRYGCNACHGGGASLIAPRLDGLFGREVRLHNGTTIVADENYILESILDPSAKLVAGYPAPSLMPTYKGVISHDDLSAMVEYIKSLERGWPQEETRP